ncbi:MAG: helix-turn-helix transcriptional regulator [Pseudomonadota bacterium]
MVESVGGKGKADTIDHHVGMRLKSRRILLGLSQQALGEAVQVSVQQIQKYEKATNRISCGKIYRLSQLLQVPIDYFFDNNKSVDEGGAAFAEEQDSFESERVDLSERELISLIRSYKEIKDPKKRQQIIELVKTVSGT